MTIALPAQPLRRLIPFDLSLPILAIVAAVLVVLIVLPMSWLVYYSVTDKDGAFTLANFVQLATDPVFVEPFLTTLILATSSAVICCAVAAPIGWLVARTDMPLRRFVRALVIPAADALQAAHYFETESIEQNGRAHGRAPGKQIPS